MLGAFLMPGDNMYFLGKSANLFIIVNDISRIDLQVSPLNQASQVSTKSAESILANGLMANRVASIQFV